ncbi:biopolymer transport protein [Cylindrospermum stagnale PCC 7417]|uniref:Biopolymer transport protein n=1 Tax=Cylindrospermum stagnale PCC 7417 TaxID=56107 RepID=K9WZU6_9NOST|nr:biopolymer transporter ExbD [Cylindrospermum stagnale]AFZ25339.1 biopolymer transport protein [Cylindrospermum stagnale PCC 7417]
MKVNLHTPIEEVQIQIIPLIDVVFCILTFFLLAALQFTRQQAINVDLPKANTGTTSAANSQSGSKILPVTIDAVGQTYIEKEAVNRQDLAERLKQYVQANPDGILVLNASRTATYNDVIQTLDLLREVGGNRVSLGIIPGSSQVPINSPNQPTNPSLPINPGTTPIPNTAPVPGNNLQGNPNSFNPYMPYAPNQVPFPTAPGQEGVSPVNPGVSPVVPSQMAPQVPVVPGNTKPAPQR